MRVSLYNTALLTKALSDFQIIMPSACDSLIEDIEDMVSSSDPTPHERQSARKSIIPRSRRKKDLSHEELQADRYVKRLIQYYSSQGWEVTVILLLYSTCFRLIMANKFSIPSKLL